MMLTRKFSLVPLTLIGLLLLTMVLPQLVPVEYPKVPINSMQVHAQTVRFAQTIPPEDLPKGTSIAVVSGNISWAFDCLPIDTKTAKITLNIHVGPFNGNAGGDLKADCSNVDSVLDAATELFRNIWAVAEQSFPEIFTKDFEDWFVRKVIDTIVAWFTNQLP